MDKKIIHSVLENTATEQEAIEVAQWLGEAGGQLMAADMIDADMEMMVPCFDTRACADRERVGNNKVNRWWRVAAMAAMVALVLTLGIGVMMLEPKEQQPEVVMQTICAERGEQIHVALQDGTHICLNSDSRLTFPSQFTEDHRKVSLVGEAYFEVQKDQHRPFMVELNGVSVEVLGTKFDVKSYKNELLQVNLDEGHVVFHGKKQKVDMRPGERLSYDRNTCFASICRNADTDMASAWKEHRLEVSEMPMQELETVLERQYDVQINIRDAKCYEYLYSMVVTEQNLKKVLKRMSSVSPIGYQYDEETGYVMIYAKQ